MIALFNKIFLGGEQIYLNYIALAAPTREVATLEG